MSAGRGSQWAHTHTIQMGKIVLDEYLKNVWATRLSHRHIQNLSYHSDVVK